MKSHSIKRIEVLNCPMDVISMDDTVDLIADKIKHKHFMQHVVVNVAKIINMRHDPILNESVRSCEMINIDGMGVLLGARFLGHDIKERVAGIDLFYRLLQMSAEQGFSIFLLGAKNEVVEETCQRIKKLYPKLKVAGIHHGYFWDNEEAVVNKIRHSKARLLFVAITSPKKENFIHHWQERLGVDFVMGVGGTFDVVAGKVKRAPIWMQDYGLEWLYRVIQEPGRMWKRYLRTNSQFLWLLIKSKLGLKINE